MIIYFKVASNLTSNAYLTENWDSLLQWHIFYDYRLDRNQSFCTLHIFVYCCSQFKILTQFTTKQDISMPSFLMRFGTTLATYCFLAQKTEQLKLAESHSITALLV